MSQARRGHVMRVLYGWGWAIAIAQFFNGSIETSLTPHYPALAARMHVGPAGLGLALAAFRSACSSARRSVDGSRIAGEHELRC